MCANEAPCLSTIHRKLVCVTGVMMARMDKEDLFPHQQMIPIGQSVNMISATVCPVPPLPPPGGQRQVSYSVLAEEPKKSCSLDSDENKLKCFSFESIFVTAASYGKKKLSRELCNGQKDSAQVYTDCIYDATDKVGDLCRGNSSCASSTKMIKSLASAKLPMLDSSDCKKGQKNLLTIEYICGESF